MYMSSLANYVAEKLGNPIVTDTPYFQPMIRYFQETKTEFEESSDIGHALASLVIKTVIPKDIKTVGISQIVEFRDDYQKERVRFYEAIQDIVGNISRIEDPVAYEDCLEHHKIEIIDAVDGLRMSLTNVGIGCVSSLLGLSVPSWATSLAEIFPEAGPQIVIVGLVGMGVYAVWREGNKYYQSRKSSPWSYVLSLNEEFNTNRMIDEMLPVY